MVWPWDPTKRQKGWIKELNQQTNMHFLWRTWKLAFQNTWHAWRQYYSLEYSCSADYRYEHQVKLKVLSCYTWEWKCSTCSKLLHSKSCLLDLSRILFGSEEPRCSFLYIHTEILFEYSTRHSFREPEWFQTSRSCFHIWKWWPSENKASSFCETYLPSLTILAWSKYCRGGNTYKTPRLGEND